VGLLLGATLRPALLARPAALALCLSSTLLLYNIWCTLRCYTKFSQLSDPIWKPGGLT
jgi:hypothetical protein